MFLFVKYQHGAYWWSMVYLSRNFLVNLSLVVFPVVMYQRCSVMNISLVYLAVVALVWPYRSDFCNRAEFCLCTLSVVINAAVMSAFALVDDAGTQTGSVDLARAVTYFDGDLCCGSWLLALDGHADDFGAKIEAMMPKAAPHSCMRPAAAILTLSDVLPAIKVPRQRRPKVGPQSHMRPAAAV